MLFHVTETYRHGVRLSRAEVLAAQPLLGKLEICDWRENNAENRALRVAYLHHATISYYPSLLKPLFDPEIVRMTSAGFLLLGWQIHATSDQTTHYKQGWWVTAPQLSTDSVDKPAAAGRQAAPGIEAGCLPKI